MRPVDFPQSNRTLAVPPGMEENCDPLHVHTDDETCISLWQLSPSDLSELISNGGRIFVGVLSGATQPPIWLSPSDPWAPSK